MPKGDKPLEIDAWHQNVMKAHVWLLVSGCKSRLTAKVMIDFMGNRSVLRGRGLFLKPSSVAGESYFYTFTASPVHDRESMLWGGPNFMEVDWSFLLASLVFLFLPSTALYPSVAKERLSVLHDHAFPLEGMVMSWQNWFDLIRSSAGTFFLASLSFAPDAQAEHGPVMILAVTGIILALALIAQTVHYRKTLYMTAPVFFLWGMIAVLIPPISAAFAIVFSAAFGRMFNHVDLKFLAMAGLIPTVGYLINDFSPFLFLSTALAAFPVVLAYLAAGSLVCYTRNLAL